MRRLQRFKLNIASSVVTQQNSNLDSLGTDQILDLFQVSSASDVAAPPQEDPDKPVGQKALLEGLGELQAEDECEYFTAQDEVASPACWMLTKMRPGRADQDLDLGSFTASLGVR